MIHEIHPEVPRREMGTECSELHHRRALPENAERRVREKKRCERAF